MRHSPTLPSVFKSSSLIIFVVGHFTSILTSSQDRAVDIATNIPELGTMALVFIAVGPTRRDHCRLTVPVMLTPQFFYEEVALFTKIARSK